MSYQHNSPAATRTITPGWIQTHRADSSLYLLVQGPCAQAIKDDTHLRGGTPSGGLTPQCLTSQSHQRHLIPSPLTQAPPPRTNVCTQMTVTHGARRQVCPRPVQNAMADLTTGWAKYHSPHCMLLLMRLTRLSKLQLQTNEILGSIALLMTCLEAASKVDPAGGKDPNLMVIDYPDSYPLFGDAVPPPPFTVQKFHLKFLYHRCFFCYKRVTSVCGLFP